MNLSHYLAHSFSVAQHSVYIEEAESHIDVWVFYAQISLE